MSEDRRRPSSGEDRSECGGDQGHGGRRWRGCRRAEMVTPRGGGGDVLARVRRCCRSWHRSSGRCAVAGPRPAGRAGRQRFHRRQYRGGGGRRSASPWCAPAAIWASAAARTRGSRRCRPDVGWVLVCNPDLVFAAGRDRRADGRRSGAGRGPPRWARSCAPRTVWPYPSARELPSLGRGIGHAVFGWWWPTNPWTKAYRRDHEIPAERPAGWLSGACVLLRRERVRRGRRLRRALLHVLRGRRPRRAARPRAAGRTSTCRLRSSPTSAGIRPAGSAAAMTAAHHESAYRYLAERHPGGGRHRCGWVLQLGLAGRQALARRSPMVAEGAAVPDNAAVPAAPRCPPEGGLTADG